MLLDNGIYTTFRYQPLHLTALHQQGVSRPNSERLNEHGLNLPLHPRLDASDIDRSIGLIGAFGHDHGL
jgi:aminotransferase